MKSNATKQITNLEQLRDEISRVKTGIRVQETSLGKKVDQVPREAVKSVGAAVLPMILGGEMAAGVFKLAKGAIGLIKRKGKPEEGEEAVLDSNWKETLVGGAKQLGFFGALKLLFSLWKGK
ncbi:MAG: hypothetical protein V4450_01105 [Bacteroidota bacterium]